MFLSYLSFFTFLSCLLMGVAGFLLDPKAKLNRAFVIYVSIISFWSFADIFYNISTDERVTWLWYKVEAVGWCGMIFGIIYLLLVYSNYYEKTPRLIKIFIIAYPLALFIWNLFEPLYIKGFSQGVYGKQEFIDISAPGFFLVQIPTFLSTAIGIFFVNKACRKSDSKRFRAQAKSYLMVSVLTYSFGAISNAAPAISNGQIPSTGSFFVLIFITGNLYLMYKYRLMHLDFNIIKEEYIDALTDMVAIISPEMKLLKANKTSLDITGYSMDETLMKYYPDFFHEKETLIKEIKNAIAQKEKIRIKQITTIGKNGKNIFGSILICPIIDNFGDHIGTIIIGRPNIEFDKIISLYKITEQEKLMISYIIQGLSNKEISDKTHITTGTVKNYISSIYKKTNLSNRVELSQLFLNE
jgi:PAS domain S-box-containing protein